MSYYPYKGNKYTNPAGDVRIVTQVDPDGRVWFKSPGANSESHATRDQWIVWWEMAAQEGDDHD